MGSRWCVTLKFKVNADLNAILASKLANASDKAAHAVAVQAQKDTSPFVPALNESLDQRTVIDNNLIVYPAPYARYLYYGKLMVDPATGSAYAPKGTTKVLTDKNLVFNKTVHSQAQAFWFEASKAQNIDKWIRVAGKAVDKYV